MTIEADLTDRDIIDLVARGRKHRESIFSLFQKSRRHGERMDQWLLHQKKGAELAAIQVHRPIELHICLAEEQGGFSLIRLGREMDIEAIDRKSTRLNSSHGYISY